MNRYKVIIRQVITRENSQPLSHEIGTSKVMSYPADTYNEDNFKFLSFGIQNNFRRENVCKIP